jgi:uncharacterized membrane protein
MKFSKKRLIWLKVYIDRARMYVGYINFLMIGFVFLHTFENKRWVQVIFENSFYTYPLIIVFTLLIFLFIGFLDTKLGLRREELENISNANPVVRELLDSIREIKERVNEKES